MNNHIDDETALQPLRDRAADELKALQENETRPPTDTPGATPAPVPKSAEESGRTACQSHEAAAQAREKSADSKKLSIPPLFPAGYKMLRKLGRGTFGEVWLAEQEFQGGQPGQHRIYVAIKFFTGRDKAQLQRMVDEAKILTRLRSDPRIVYLIDHDAEVAPPYFVMDFMERGSLAAHLAEGTPMPVEKALFLFREIVEAMAFVHAKGIRHCDLKPGNILLNADGKPKVADFGQAHLSLEPTEQALGTFFYMAPEQANTEHQVPDSGWDVYGLGALFFAMVTGKPPRYDKQFADELANTVSMTTKLARYRKWVQEAPTPTEHRKKRGMDRELADIIERCICIDPAKRLPDADAVLAALEQRERNRRQKPFLVLAGAVFLTMILLMGFFIYFAVKWSQEDLQERVLDSDLITANLVANVVRDNLDYEMTRLETWAMKPKDQEAEGPKKPKDLPAKFLEFERDRDPEKRKKLEQMLMGFSRTSRFNSLNIFDREGKLQVAVDRTTQPKLNPHPTEYEFAISQNYDKQFSWRNYWNRKEDHYKQREDFFPYKPNLKDGKDVPYIGQPFVSTAQSKYVAITISIAIYDSSDPKEMIGLLMGSINLSDLHHWIDPVEAKQGCAVLIDGHGYCVHHQRDYREALKPEENSAPEKKDFKLQDSHWKDWKRRDHQDPYTGNTYLAVHIPIQEYGWDVIVQHDRAMVVHQTDQIKLRLLVLFSTVVVVAILILAGLWWGSRWFERVSRRLSASTRR